MKSWTEPGDGFFNPLQERVQQNNKPDNPKDKVGDAVNRRTEYSHIYVDGLPSDFAKELVKEFGNIVDTKWVDKKVWGTVGKDRKDIIVKGKTVTITNNKLGHIGGSQSDVVMVQKQIAGWIEVGDHEFHSYTTNVKIGSILNSQR